MTQETKGKCASVAPAEELIQYGQTGGVSKGSIASAVNNGNTTVNNITINDSEVRIGSPAPDKVEKAPGDENADPNQHPEGNEATPGNSDSARTPGQVQEVAVQTDGKKQNYKIQLNEIEVPYRMAAKHNIENTVLIAEKHEFELKNVYAFLLKISNDIGDFGDNHNKPVKDVSSAVANPDYVDIDLTNITNESIRLLTKHSVDIIVFIAIFQPEAMIDISNFLSQFIPPEDGFIFHIVSLFRCLYNLVCKYCKLVGKYLA